MGPTPDRKRSRDGISVLVCVQFLALIGVKTADCLVHGVQDGGAVLGEQVDIEHVQLEVTEQQAGIHAAC